MKTVLLCSRGKSNLLLLFWFLWAVFCLSEILSIRWDGKSRHQELRHKWNRLRKGLPDAAVIKRRSIIRTRGNVSVRRGGWKKAKWHKAIELKSESAHTLYSGGDFLQSCLTWSQFDVISFMFQLILINLLWLCLKLPLPHLAEEQKCKCWKYVIHPLLFISFLQLDKMR